MFWLNYLPVVFKFLNALEMAGESHLDDFLFS